MHYFDFETYLNAPVGPPAPKYFPKSAPGVEPTSLVVSGTLELGISCSFSSDRYLINSREKRDMELAIKPASAFWFEGSTKTKKLTSPGLVPFLT